MAEPNDFTPKVVSISPNMMRVYLAKLYRYRLQRPSAISRTIFGGGIGFPSETGAVYPGLVSQGAPVPAPSALPPDAGRQIDQILSAKKDEEIVAEFNAISRQEMEVVVGREGAEKWELAKKQVAEAQAARQAQEQRILRAAGMPAGSTMPTLQREEPKQTPATRPPAKPPTESPLSYAELRAMSDDDLAAYQSYARRQPQVLFEEDDQGNVYPTNVPTQWGAAVKDIDNIFSDREKKAPSAAEQKTDWLTTQYDKYRQSSMNYGTKPSGFVPSEAIGEGAPPIAEQNTPRMASDWRGNSLDELYDRASWLQQNEQLVIRNPAGYEELTPAGREFEALKTAIGRAEDVEKQARSGGGGGGGDGVGWGQLALERERFEYGKTQDELNRKLALDKERIAILKAKAEAEQWLAQLEGQAQDRYSEAASWGIFPKGQPAPTSPSFPGLPGLDLNQYRVKAPDFYGPAKTARDRIMQQLAAMKVGE